MSVAEARDAGSPTEIAPLVRAASDGDPEAWAAIVKRFAGLVWAVARGHGLSSADAADVSQTTWLRLAEHLHRIREPERLAGWLATTARNEALRMLRRSQRHLPMDDCLGCAPDQQAPDVERGLLDEERDAALWRAFESLSGPCKVLLRVLIADPAPSYAEVSAMLGMPVGSIGPTRSRCLTRLRRSAELATGEHEDDVLRPRRTAV